MGLVGSLKLTENNRYIECHTKKDWLENKHLRWASKKTLSNTAEARGSFLRSSHCQLVSKLVLEEKPTLHELPSCVSYVSFCLRASLEEQARMSL